MAEQVERSSLDLRYRDYRLKSPSKEKRLLASILQQGILEPLRGTYDGDVRILLDGFKRYRCACRLSIDVVPFVSLSRDEVEGIIQLIRMSDSKGLSIIEQSRLIDDLRCRHRMTLSQIASHLDKSKSWVSMRAGLMDRMSAVIKEKIFSGAFPAYSFMYSIRKFMRMNEVSCRDVERFVSLVSGNGLSTRDIDILAREYFGGNEGLRDQLATGDVCQGLRYLKEGHLSVDPCSPSHQRFLKELGIAGGYIDRVIYEGNKIKKTDPLFSDRAQGLCARILNRLDRFKIILEDFTNDR